MEREMIVEWKPKIHEDIKHLRLGIDLHVDISTDGMEKNIEITTTLLKLSALLPPSRPTFCTHHK